MTHLTDGAPLQPGMISTLRRRLRPLAALGRSVWSVRRHHLLRYDLDDPAPRITPRVSVVFREATTNEMERFTSDPAHEISAKAARLQSRLLELGCRCSIGLAEGRIVYHGWTTQRWWRIAGPRDLLLGNGKALIFRCFTIAEMRRQGIYAAALASDLQELKRRGVREVFINVDDKNHASLKAVEKVGFASVGTYTVLHTMGLVSVWMKPELRQRLVSHSQPANP
jgi:RimJ/RimL family protein N-acetyltransferase